MEIWRCPQSVVFRDVAGHQGGLYRGFHCTLIDCAFVSITIWSLLALVNYTHWVNLYLNREMNARQHLECTISIASRYQCSTTASPFVRSPWRMGDAAVGRGSTGRTTSKSGRPCPRGTAHDSFLQKRLEEDIPLESSLVFQIDQMDSLRRKHAEGRLDDRLKEMK